uniref:Uncharacterized protein n=1 Tax=viral metagenome TaxID=1070528 RepID=A0A6C0J475_9ZZZZ
MESFYFNKITKAEIKNIDMRSPYNLTSLNFTVKFSLHYFISILHHYSVNCNLLRNDLKKYIYILKIYEKVIKNFI